MVCFGMVEERDKDRNTQRNCLKENEKLMVSTRDGLKLGQARRGGRTGVSLVPTFTFFPSPWAVTAEK